MATTPHPRTGTGIAAAILAGGRGERLGGTNKALLEIGGRRLIDRAIRAVAESCDTILVMVGRTPLPELDFPQVYDLETDYGGPLAGLAAAVGALAAQEPEFVVSLAVDTPFFPHDFVGRAQASIGPCDAVLAAYAGQPYPTNGLWRFAAIASLPARLRDGTAPHSLRRFAGTLDTRALDYAQWAAEDPFANANTPAELAFLAARAERERPD